MKLLKWPPLVLPCNCLVLALILYTFAVGVVRSTNNCSPFIITPGWTIPRGDIELPEGSNLTVFCQLNETIAKEKKLSSSQIYFVLKNQRISSENVSILNETTALLHLDHMSVMNDWLYCQLDILEPPSPPSSSLEVNRTANTSSDSFVCANVISVGAKPKDVLNFSCFSYGDKELNCTWLEPYNEVRTTYTLSYQMPSEGGGHVNYGCPKYENIGRKEVDGKEVKRKRCSWTSYSEPPYRPTFEYLTFTIEGSNFVGVRTQTMAVPQRKSLPQRNPDYDWLF